MDLADSNGKRQLLQQILEGKLRQVFHYTQYSFLVSDQTHSSAHHFLTDYATQTLEQSREVTRALVLLNATYKVDVSSSIREPKEMALEDILQQAIADETDLLSLCKILNQQVSGQNIYFSQLARSLVIETHHRITGLRHRLHMFNSQAVSQRGTVVNNRRREEQSLRSA